VGGATTVPIRFTGRIVLMTAIALMLIALALSLPWYKSETVREYTWYGESRTVTLTTQYYIDYYESPEGLRQYSDFHEDLSNIMSLEKVLIYCWLLFGFLFLAAVLINLRIPSILLGWITLALCVLAVVQFAGRIREEITTWSASNTTYTADIGFMTAIAATALQVIAVLARSYVLYPEVAAHLGITRPKRTA
jgi:hypothetical protein